MKTLGLSIKSRQFGRAKSPVKIVAVHGWLDNAASFEPLARACNEFFWVAPELPGHGYSDHRSLDASYGFWEYALFLRKFIDSTKIKSFVLVGHSLGAAVALNYASAFPEKVNKLILIDSLGPLTMEPQEFLDRLRAYSSELSEKPKLRIFKNLKEAIQARIKATPMKQESAELLVKRGIKKTKQGYMWRSDPKLKLTNPIRLSEDIVRTMISSIKCPTLALRSSEVSEQNEKLWKNRAQFFKSIDVRTLTGGHHVHMDEPQIVGEILKEFLLATSEE